MKILFGFIFFFVTQAFAGPVALWGPGYANLLLPEMCLTTAFACVLSGSSNPSSVAVSAPKGSIYLSTNGTSYIKQDAGLTTNWTALAASGGGVTSVTASSPLFSSGGTTPNITEQVANTSQNGYLTSTDWNTFNGKQAAGSYITALTGDVTASGPGSVAATIANLAVTNAKIANTTIDLTAKVTGLLPLGNLASLQVNKNLYVDGSRTDTYTADGSSFRPFKTIAAAVSQVITNADNSSHQYTINLAPGGYSETITLNNAALYNLIFTTTTSAIQTSTQGTTVTGLTSTSTNTNLGTLFVIGITINGSVNLTGDITNTNLCSAQCTFNGVQINNSSGTVTFNNVNNVNFYGGQIQGTGSVTTATNCAFCYTEGAEGFIGGTTVHLVDNPGGNIPSQYSGNYWLFSNTKFYGTMTIDAGSELDVLQSYFGSTSSVTNNGTIHSWVSSWAGTTNGLVLNNGSTWRNRGDIVWNPPTVNSGATVNNQAYTYMLGGTFGTSAVTQTNAAIVTKDGHYKSMQTTTPTTTLSGNAGTGGSPSCTVANATDTAGTITLVTGTASWASGTQCTINFNKSYGTAPICVISEAIAQAAASKVTQQINAPDAATGSFTINFGVADTAQHTFKWKYHCLETQ